MITKKQFESYMKVQKSGKTNMWDTRKVGKLSKLTKEQCMETIGDYSELKEKYKG